MRFRKKKKEKTQKVPEKTDLEIMCGESEEGKQLYKFLKSFMLLEPGVIIGRTSMKETIAQAKKAEETNKGKILLLTLYKQIIQFALYEKDERKLGEFAKKYAKLKGEKPLIQGIEGRAVQVAQKYYEERPVEAKTN
jgi:hypothetical protein